MEFLCKYDFNVHYIEGKENVVANALSRRHHGILTLTLGVDLRGCILQHLPEDGWFLEVQWEIQSHRALVGKFASYSLDADQLLRHQQHIYVPHAGDLHTIVLSEAHMAPYAAHLGVKKMHADLQKLYH